MFKFDKRYLITSVIGMAVVSAVLAATGTIQTWTGKGSRRSTVEMELVSPSLGSPADLLPGTANVHDLGNTTRYWNDAYAGSFIVKATVSTQTTPVEIGIIARSSINTQELYISTAVAAQGWQKIGAQ